MERANAKTGLPQEDELRFIDVNGRIDNSGGDLQTDNDIIEKFCYNNDPANCTI